MHKYSKGKRTTSRKELYTFPHSIHELIFLLRDIYVQYALIIIALYICLQTLYRYNIYFI